jgi:hypothetical protein
MSNNTELEVINSSNEWIGCFDEAIAKNYIKYYEYNYFSNIQLVGSGNFGKVYRANWKDSHNHLALKSFFNFNRITVNEIINEVMILFKIFFIVTFLIKILIYGLA